MARPQQAPRRSLTDHERTTMDQVARAGAEPADRVAHAKALLAVAAGATFTAAARAAGRRSGDAVAKLVGRCHQEGLAVLTRRPGGAPPLQYGPDETARMLREARRPPDRALDGTAPWSLTTRQRALRQAPDGLPQVSPCPIVRVRHDAGFSGQHDRTWCETGVGEVVDPDASTPRG